MANKEISELDAAALPLDLTEILHIVQSGNSRKVAVGGLLGEVKWLSRAIGEPFPLWDHLTGADVPPIDSALYRFIKLTAGEDGTGEYNEGVLTSESVAGSAPLVIATAVIDDAASPLDGETVSLINTERRFLRAGEAGTVQADALQGFKVNIGGSGSASGAFGFTAGTTSSQQSSGPVSDGTNGTPRIANETRGKNIGATYYMRIK